MTENLLHTSISERHLTENIREMVNSDVQKTKNLLHLTISVGQMTMYRTQFVIPVLHVTVKLYGSVVD